MNPCTEKLVNFLPKEEWAAWKRTHETCSNADKRVDPDHVGAPLFWSPADCLGTRPACPAYRIWERAYDRYEAQR